MCLQIFIQQIHNKSKYWSLEFEPNSQLFAVTLRRAFTFESKAKWSVHSQGRPQDFFQVGHRRRKGSVVGGHHGECGARVYNGGLGAEPPAGSRGRAPGQGVRGAKPPEAESILVIGCPTEPASLAPFQKCICISTLGATVIIWEKNFVEIQGVR